MSTMKSGGGSGTIPNTIIPVKGTYFDAKKPKKKQKKSKTGSSYFNKTKP